MEEFFFHARHKNIFKERLNRHTPMVKLWKKPNGSQKESILEHVPRCWISNNMPSIGLQFQVPNQPHAELSAWIDLLPSASFF